MSLFLRSYLSDSTPERCHKAQEAITTNQLAITIAHQDDSQIRALVQHGDHAEHGVTLTEHGGCCGCRDFAYRGVICFHQVGVAMYALAHPEPVHNPIHLLLDDNPLCGAPWTSTLRTWRRWTDNALNWKDLVCQDCVAIYRSGYNVHVLMKEAA